MDPLGPGRRAAAGILRSRAGQAGWPRCQNSLCLSKYNRHGYSVALGPGGDSAWGAKKAGEAASRRWQNFLCLAANNLPGAGAQYGCSVTLLPTRDRRKGRLNPLGPGGDSAWGAKKAGEAASRRWQNFLCLAANNLPGAGAQKRPARHGTKKPPGGNLQGVFVQPCSPQRTFGLT